MSTITTSTLTTSILDYVHAYVDSLETVNTSDVRNAKLADVNREKDNLNELNLESVSSIDNMLSNPHRTVYSFSVVESKDKEGLYHVKLTRNDYALNSTLFSKLFTGKEQEQMLSMVTKRYNELKESDKSSVSVNAIKKTIQDIVQKMYARETEKTDIADTLKKLVITSADVADIMSMFEQDATYYTMKREATLDKFMSKLFRITARHFNSENVTIESKEDRKNKTYKSITIYEHAVQVAVSEQEEHEQEKVSA